MNRTAPIAVALAIAALLGLSACGAPGGEASPGATPVPTETSAPTESPAPEPELTPLEQAQAEVDALEWRRVDVSPAGFSFETPSGWELGQAEHSVPEAPHYELRDERGELRLRFAGAMGGVGGTCGDRLLSEVEVVAAEQVDLAGIGSRSFQLYVMHAPDGIVGALALLPNAGSATEYAPTCSVYNLVELPDLVAQMMPQGYFATSMMLTNFTAPGNEDPALRFDSVADARAYTETFDYLMLKRIVTSLEYRG